MKDFFEKFKHDVLEFRKSFNKKHGIMFGIGLTTTLFAITAGVMFGVFSPDAIMSEILCYTLGGITGTTATLVAANGISGSKKLKELSTADKDNMVKLINKYSEDENKNVRDFAKVLFEEHRSNEVAEIVNLNPFEDLVSQPKIPTEAFKKPVEEALDDAKNSPVDFDI